VNRDDRRTELYPDLVRAGSLAAALDEELSKGGSDLRASRDFYGAKSVSFASVARGQRVAQVLIGLEERLFILSLWESQVVMADGDTPDLSAVAAAIRLALEDGGRRISDLAAEIPFLELAEFALSYERGTYIEDKWQALLARPTRESGNEVFHWDELAELIRLASERPELRRLLPYTTLHRFSVTAKSRPPDHSIPVVCPLGDGQYALTSYWGEQVFARGNATVVLNALVEHALKVQR
jgi:Family of unknown function (DUF6193)